METLEQVSKDFIEWAKKPALIELEKAREATGDSTLSLTQLLSINIMLFSHRFKDALTN